MEVLLDNIIFSLQKGGGASVVWKEHIARLKNDVRFNVRYLEFQNAFENVFRKRLNIPNESLIKISDFGISIKRYFDIKSNRTSPYIFHSSHYRLDKCKYARNITTVHDFVYEYYVGGVKQKIHSLQKWRAIRGADVVICISESTKRDLLHFIPEIDEKRITVIYNGVDNSYYKMQPAEYKLSLPFETGEYALYVGNRRTPYKNFLMTAEACSKMRLPLIMVGGEQPNQKEIKLLNQLLKGRFAFYHGITNIELNELYNRAKVFLYPSLYEGFGIPIIEAQRAGTPVICVNSSSIPEIVGQTDLCIKESVSTMAICERIMALENSSFREGEIERGLDNSKRFCWDETYRQTSNIYVNLLNC